MSHLKCLIMTSGLTGTIISALISIMLGYQTVMPGLIAGTCVTVILVTCVFISEIKDNKEQQ